MWFGQVPEEVCPWINLKSYLSNPLESHNTSVKLNTEYSKTKAKCCESHWSKFTVFSVKRKLIFDYNFTLHYVLKQSVWKMKKGSSIFLRSQQWSQGFVSFSIFWCSIKSGSKKCKVNFKRGLLVYSFILLCWPITNESPFWGQDGWKMNCNYS